MPKVVMCVYCCSDILTPLPALGIEFEIDDRKGPIIANPIQELADVQARPHQIQRIRPIVC